MTVVASTPINKVAEVSLIFWLIKMMSTTMGETGADFLIFKLHWGLTITSIVMALPLLAALLGQIFQKRYHHWLYWITVLLVSIVGTLITDMLTDHWHVPLLLSSCVFSIFLALIFFFWYKQENTLSIATINTRKREIFYWLAILITFALGTAVGDWISEELNWGYLTAALFFGGIILAIATAYYGLNADKVTCFWMVYILTRPLGASIGDFLSHSAKKGGLGFGTTNTSLAFLVAIIILVLFSTKTAKKIK